MSARELRSAQRAKAHNAQREAADLPLHQLMHRYLARVRWQQMQDVAMAWFRETVPSSPPPAPPPRRPLEIVDPSPAPPSGPKGEGASADYEMQDNRGSKREVESTPPKAIPEPTRAQQTSLRKQRRREAKKLAAAFDAAAAEPAFGPWPAAASTAAPDPDPPPSTSRPAQALALPALRAAIEQRRESFASEGDFITSCIDGVMLDMPSSDKERVERETELRNLLPNFDKNGRMVPPGMRYAIANGDICLPPDLVHRVMHEKRPPP